MKLKLLLTTSLICICTVGHAEIKTIKIDAAVIEDLGTYPKIARTINPEEPGVTRTIEAASGSNQYVAKQVKEVTEDWDSLDGYCNRGDIAISASCAFEKSSNMMFLLHSNGETDEIIGIGCEFDVAERFATERPYGNVVLEVVCQKK